MTRRVAAVVFALALTPMLAHAQDTAFTVNVPSAEVYAGPSNIYPVIGHAKQGAVLTVSRNLGSWVKIAWPDAKDGVGYVSLTSGRLGPANAAAPAAKAQPRASSAPAGGRTPSQAAAPRQAPAPAAAAAPAPTQAAAPRPAPRPAPVSSGSTASATKVARPSHIIGIGGMLGSMSAFGATARAWPDDRLGIQLALTRDAMTSDVAVGRVTSVQFEPGAIYAPFNRVSDYVWFRPYVGSALTFRHQTLNETSVTPAPEDNSVGFRIFGGSELTFANVPQLGLSVDVGYRHDQIVFAGFEPSHLTVSIAGHWYIR